MNPASNHHKVIAYIVLGIIIVIALGAYIYFMLSNQPKQQIQTAVVATGTSMRDEQMQAAAMLSSQPPVIISPKDQKTVATQLASSKTSVSAADEQTAAAELRQQ